MTDQGATAPGSGLAAPRIAYLGPAGTFSQAAVDRHFGPAADKLGVSSIDEVFVAVESGQAHYGVVPVENSTEGAVNYTQDCLIDTSLSIVAEIVIAIEHNFLVSSPEAVGSIRRIVSHRQSLAQCRLWLKKHWPGVPQQEVSSNAEAARLAAEDLHTAAIASKVAAKNYGLTVHAEGIQDRSNNCTRFLVLATHTVPSTGRDKTSILVYTRNRPGALFHVLEPFERHQISLTKIETRPAREEAWAYVFFIDFEGHVDDEAVQAVMSELQERAIRVRRLGSYPVAAEQ